jgi:signal transduction histidine kinase
MQMPAEQPNHLDTIDVLYNLTKKINQGLTLDEVLNYIYDSFEIIIPYDRIGVAFLENNNKDIIAVWSKSKASKIILEKGYSAPLEGSTLENIIKLNKPRILNDLKTYLDAHPDSVSSQKIVEEGIRSSLTCPLIVSNKYVGFLFFSSMQTNTYKNAHVDLFQQIAGQISTIIEKSHLYKKVLELSDLKTKFLGIAAHDLRNPINVIKGNIDLIKEGIIDKNSEEFTKTIDTMLTHLSSMLNIINTFLDVSVIEAGRLELKKEKIIMDSFLQECFEANKLLAQKKQITLNLENGHDLPEMFIDKERIKQVINNLITNSIKFSNPNTSVTLKTEKKDSSVEISVIDQGQGIPENEINNLFVFYGKTSTAPTQKEKSTGLGLAICKKIVEEHSGKIWAKNNPDKGTTFTFSLPIE